MKDISNYIRAGFAALFIQTHEEALQDLRIKEVAENLEYGLYKWTVTTGMINMNLTNRL